MAKIRLTKNELKKQKDNLKRFLRYLPTLELKKKQLIQEIQRIQGEIEKLHTESVRLGEEVSRWAAVFADGTDLEPYLRIREVLVKEDNVAGIDIPVFVEAIFEPVVPDTLKTPFWTDRGIAVCREEIARRLRIETKERQMHILREELRITIQRIKLFEEVKIPDARDNIRVIQIFLGDLRTAEVVRGKIAKAKIERKKARLYHA